MEELVSTQHTTVHASLTDVNGVSCNLDRLTLKFEGNESLTNDIRL